jgi:hypothetical protein
MPTLNPKHWTEPLATLPPVPPSDLPSSDPVAAGRQVAA